MATKGSVYDQAIEYGLHLSDEFISEFKQKQGNDTDLTFQTFLRKLLDFDLRKQPFVKPFFPNDGNLHVCQLSELVGPAVLQVVSVSNVSEPSKRQLKGDGGPHDVYRVVLTDGHSKVSSFSTGAIPDIHTGTSPGTKVLLSKAKIFNSYLVLTASSLKNIGGKVEYLHEAFLANQAAQRLRMIQAGKQDRSSSSAVPPPVFEPLSTTTTTTKREAGSTRNTGPGKAQNPAVATAVASAAGGKKKSADAVASAPPVASMKGLSLKEDKATALSGDQKPSTAAHTSSSGNHEGHRGAGRGRGRGDSRGDDTKDGRGAGRGRGRDRDRDSADHEDRPGSNRGSGSGRGRGRGSGGGPGGRDSGRDSGRGRGGGREHRGRGERPGQGERDGRYVQGRYQVETQTDTGPAFNLADTLSFPTLAPGSTQHKDWVCKNCTFSNNYQLSYCEMCDTAK